MYSGWFDPDGSVWPASAVDLCWTSGAYGSASDAAAGVTAAVDADGSGAGGASADGVHSTCRTLTCRSYVAWLAAENDAAVAATAAGCGRAVGALHVAVVPARACNEKKNNSVHASKNIRKRGINARRYAHRLLSNN